MKLYSVKDVKGAFAAPFLALNDSIAARNIKSYMLTQKGSDWFLYPEDFELWYIGEFDELTANISPGSLSCVCRLVALRDVENA